MALAIYKSGQGYYTRMLSAVGAAVLLLSGVAWFWNQLDAFVNAIYYQTGMAVLLIGGGGGMVYLILNRPRIVDFMIATEAEMKKVNWPTRYEVAGSTWIVICGTFMIALVLFIIDLIFGWFFLRIGILQG